MRRIAKRSYRRRQGPQKLGLIYMTSLTVVWFGLFWITFIHYKVTTICGQFVDFWIWNWSRFSSVFQLVMVTILAIALLTLIDLRTYISQGGKQKLTILGYGLILIWAGWFGAVMVTLYDHIDPDAGFGNIAQVSRNAFERDWEPLEVIVSDGNFDVTVFDGRESFGDCIGGSGQRYLIELQEQQNEELKRLYGH